MEPDCIHIVVRDKHRRQIAPAAGDEVDHASGNIGSVEGMVEFGRTEGPRSEGLKRTMPMAKFWKFIGQLAPKKKQEEFKRFSGIALLERAEPSSA